MKELFFSLAICFSMYSTIPMPKVDWAKGNMKYVFCFFPVIGLIIGFFEYLLFMTAKNIGMNFFLYAVIASVVPVIVSGGIHFDGLIDTCDAIFSNQAKEKKLEILKDPHVGAFGVIYAIIFFAITMGVYAQMLESGINPLIFLLVFAISRSVSGIITINWPSSKKSGLKHIFENGTNKVVVTRFLYCFVVILFLALSLINLYAGILSFLCVTLFYIWFYFYSKANFGGITGDLVGFSLCICEIIVLACCLIGGALILL